MLIAYLQLLNNSLQDRITQISKEQQITNKAQEMHAINHTTSYSLVIENFGWSIFSSTEQMAIFINVNSFMVFTGLC